MDFTLYLADQMKKHPSMMPQDIIKMCYQAAYGAEHLLSDHGKAWNYLFEEFAEAVPSDEPLYEQISDNVCRINIASWKAKGFPAEWLFRIFAASCVKREYPDTSFNEYLTAAEAFLRSNAPSFSMDEWTDYLTQYKKIGMPAVHHSEAYRRHEHPSYRIAHSRFCRILPIIEIAAPYLCVDRPCVIAIDGRAASGKTTLAAHLETVLGAEVIHMDHFFLPPELRDSERFKTPGENVHHERFSDEVLPFLHIKKLFSYRVFDCGKMDYSGMQEIGNTRFRIVEGSYSCHPKFGRYADITVFSDVAYEEQLRRIGIRNGEKMLEMFKSRWIPLEEEYFSHFGIRDLADIKV